MNQRVQLTVAAALVAFVLMVAGGLAARQALAPDPVATAAAATTAPPSAVSPAVLAAFQRREAAYQAALAEANRRLALANQQSAQVARADNPAAPGYSVSADQAAAAVSYRGGGDVREVKVEHEHGATVYAVAFADGGEVYVDPTSGQVVYAELDGHDGEGGHDDETGGEAHR
jgi:uncharacterized membrane protein YkoI